MIKTAVRGKYQRLFFPQFIDGLLFTQHHFPPFQHGHVLELVAQLVGLSSSSAGNLKVALELNQPSLVVFRWVRRIPGPTLHAVLADVSHLSGSPASLPLLGSPPPYF